MQSTAEPSNGSGIAAARLGAGMARIGGMPRPSKMGIAETERARLLARETEACGPHHLALRHKAVLDAIKTGDPRLLAGALDDLAAAALNFRERTYNDAFRRHQRHAATSR